MSDTPRTDNAICPAREVDAYVKADFARTLEREAAELQNGLVKLGMAGGPGGETTSGLLEMVKWHKEQECALAAQVEKMRLALQMVRYSPEGTVTPEAVDAVNEAFLSTSTSTILAEHDKEICRPLVEALQPFANLLDDNAEGVGGGTLIAPPIKVQLIKDAKAALSAIEGTKE